MDSHNNDMGESTIIMKYIIVKPKSKVQSPKVITKRT